MLDVVVDGVARGVEVLVDPGLGLDAMGPGFGVGDELPRLRLAGAAVHALQPLPVLPHGVEVLLALGDLGVQGLRAREAASEGAAEGAELLRGLPHLLHPYPHPTRHVVRHPEIRVVYEELLRHDVGEPCPHLLRRADGVEVLQFVVGESLVHAKSKVEPVGRRSQEPHRGYGPHKQAEVYTNADRPNALQVVDNAEVPLRHELPHAGDLGHLRVQVLPLLRLGGLRRHLLRSPSDLVRARLRPDQIQNGRRDVGPRRDLGRQGQMRRLVRREAVLYPHVVGDLGAVHGPEDVLDLGDAPVDASVLAQHLRRGVLPYAVAQVVLLLRPAVLDVGDQHGVHRVHLVAAILVHALDHELPLAEGPDAVLVVLWPVRHPRAQLLLDQAPHALLLLFPLVFIVAARRCRDLASAAEEVAQETAPVRLRSLGVSLYLELLPLATVNLLLACSELVVEGL
mmetsp:Transcript_8396/g.24008  ORF Transcript_8396/g.24008 Transcript_8396/m.24008 type:complete len:454 (-) Transcript_8396:177-1538(-)